MPNQSLPGDLRCRVARFFFVALIIAAAGSAGFSHAAPASPPTVTFTVTGSWDSGYNGAITIQNNNASPIVGWYLEWEGGPTVSSFWNGRYSVNRDLASVFDDGWNNTIRPGAKVSLGFGGEGRLYENIVNCTVNGVAAEVVYDGALPDPGGSAGSGGDGGASDNDDDDAVIVTPPAPGAAPTVTFSVTSNWDSGYNGAIVIKNNDSAPIVGWLLEWNDGPAVSSLWNGAYQSDGDFASVLDAGWNNTIPAGGTVTLGFGGVGVLEQNIVDCTLNGVTVELKYVGATASPDGGSGGSAGSDDPVDPVDPVDPADPGDPGDSDDSSTTTPPPPASGPARGPFACPSDLDGDSTTGDSDVDALMSAWGNAGANLAEDLNGDGTVNDADLDLLIAAWGDCPAEKRIVAYWIEWGIYGRNYHPSDTPFEKITHINYAFANIDASGRVVPFDSWAAIDKAYPGDTWDQPIRGCYNQLNNVFKPLHPHLKTLISVGGWTLSGRFSDVALSAQSRAIFAQSCVDFVRTYHFDGIDIDWEYPVSGGLSSNTYRPQDKQNFTLLLRDVRAALDAAGDADGTHYLLTIAAPAGYDKFENIEASQIHQYLDWINVMTYDFFGGWDLSYTANHGLFDADSQLPASANLREKYNTRYAMRQYLLAGVPADKLVMGLPFYGRAWGGVGPAQDGLHQPGSSVPPGTWDDWSSGATGVNDFTQIDRDFLAPGSGYVRRWDYVTKTPWLYNPNAHGGHWIGYDDEESITHKLEWAESMGLGGAMIWEITGDRDEKLLDAVGAALGAQ